MYMCACVCAKSLQSRPTLHDPMDCSLPGSSVHGIFQARALEWSAIAFSLLLSGGHKTNKPMKNKIKPNFDKPHSAEKFQLSKSSISYYFSHSDRCVVISHWIFFFLLWILICFPLMVNYVEYLFNACLLSE